MKISSLRIQNFRSFSDSTINLNDYTCLVGPNGAGKSTILSALNVFFRESGNVGTDLSELDQEDFHHKDTSEPICISLTFSDLNDEAQHDFAEYFRHGQLVISVVAHFDEDSGKAQINQLGERLGMSDFKEFFLGVGDKKPVAELKKIYTRIRETYTDLAAPGSKDSMIDALHAYESSNKDRCELIPSEDQFYGFSKGSNRLAKHIQWVYVPAVKDPTTEQTEARHTALGMLLLRTVHSKTNFDLIVKNLRTEVQGKYEKMLAENQHVLDEISTALQGRLSEWAHPDATLRLQWKQDPATSIRVEEPLAHILAGEGDFEGKLARFGHGFQRSYLLALLQELAGNDDAGGPTLILACEEPELYQHPPQARHLAAVLQKLSHGNSQVVVSTHNPLFVSGQGFQDVRMVRKDTGRPCSIISHITYDEIAEAVAEATNEKPKTPEGVLAKIHQALQPALSEMFFTRRLILVEGLEDAAYISAYLNILEKYDGYRRLGCHIVPANGKSQLLEPLVIAKHMGIPTYVVFDADVDKLDKNGSRAKHEKDNKALLTLLGKPDQNPMPSETIWETGFTMWHSEIGEIVKGEIGESEWAQYQAKADKLYGRAGGLRKNTLHIGASLAFALDDGKWSASLERLCKRLLDTENVVPVQKAL